MLLLDVVVVVVAVVVVLLFLMIYLLFAIQCRFSAENTYCQNIQDQFAMIVVTKLLFDFSTASFDHFSAVG